MLRDRRRLVAAVLAAAVLVAAWWSVAFVQRAEARLAALPAQVRHQAAARGDPYLALDAIPLGLRHAVVAVEDQSFYTNWGISVEGTLRAAWVDLVDRRFAQGGSTITQELVRDQLLGDRRTIPWKLTEIAYAVLAARRFSKSEVMTMFLNQAYFGNGAHGVAAAAHVYFGLPPQDLTLGQEALLAGLLQAPTAYDPLHHRGAAVARQAIVLQAMVTAGYISQTAADAAAREPLLLLPAQTPATARGGG